MSIWDPEIATRVHELAQEPGAEYASAEAGLPGYVGICARNVRANPTGLPLPGRGHELKQELKRAL